MEKEEYILKLSLKHMTLMTVGIDLWNQPDILHLALDLSRKHFGLQWRPKIKDKVWKKVSNLLLPENLKNLLIDYMYVLGHEILKWREFHRLVSQNLYFDLSILSQLHWKSVGAVDYQKTAEILIKEERVDVITSYKLACIYCLDKNIKIIWEKLDEDSKKLFCHEKCTYLNNRQPKLVIFWSCLMRGEVMKPLNHSINQFVFLYAAQSGNIAATKYFFQKLTLEEREACLLTTVQAIIDQFFPIPHHNHNNFSEGDVCGVLCYLLSELRKEQQIQVFEKQSSRTLQCLMFWPGFKVFMQVAELMWSILPVNDCYLLLEMLAQYPPSLGVFYFKLFKDLFSSAPIQYRNYFVDEIRQSGIKLSELFKAGNTEIFKSVVRNVHEKGRQAIIIYEAELHFCWKLIDEGKWSLLDLFVSSFRLSSESKTILKSSFMNYITRFYKEGEIKRRRRVWGRFFQLIDNANVNGGNKKIIEEMERPTRKLRRKK